MRIVALALGLAIASPASAQCVPYGPPSPVRIACFAAPKVGTWWLCGVSLGPAGNLPPDPDRTGPIGPPPAGWVFSIMGARPANLPAPPAGTILVDPACAVIEGPWEAVASWSRQVKIPLDASLVGARLFTQWAVWPELEFSGKASPLPPPGSPMLSGGAMFVIAGS